ncbi:MAG: short-chain dehydrogenase/reductase [Acidobacteriaceae bacterium]|jgi:NAD(P)-dependent dehydrogenase (short-subunit alcohol dehydrogenase family)|nr:short-chain dehydrogenase/reductase [Acidobacteriaceae bacterium]
MEKIALITGTSSGIGLLTAIDMAKAGFRVIATMRDLSRNTRLLQAAADAGVSDRIELRRLDITEFDSLPGAVAEIFRHHGRIDVLVNNAGYALGGFAEDIQLDELRGQFDTNFFGHVALTRAVLPTMRAQGVSGSLGGHIIMISSISGLVSNPVTSSYSASKHALEGWTESLRLEVRALGIKVVLVEPGAYDTDIWERNVRIGKIALSEESANKDRARRFANVVKTKLRKGDTREVSRLITRIAQDPNPNLRYLIGKDAQIRYWSQRLLPWKLYEKILLKASQID